MTDVTNEVILEAIKQADVVPDVTKLRSDVKLVDQGVDSLGLFNILLILEEKIKVKIPDDDIDKLHTVDDIRRYLQSHLRI